MDYMASSLASSSEEFVYDVQDIPNVTPICDNLIFTPQIPLHDATLFPGMHAPDSTLTFYDMDDNLLRPRHQVAQMLQ
ncbi:hypothetical protein DPMN_031688 [Dreissena polymorpha]|uniref:Uncharacterized protein n=1 Tax=Dreissena polymorpha TaxID=45954 RepID=A0A9D4M1I3_DREPO|nr:hypothetical protein DPMN_031628 [Dreissena polymorpha]KAH3868538.1 hypothetical protein DPMN_031688 [Dreissena polymorpha]